jgi:hypothetical protein
LHGRGLPDGVRELAELRSRLGQVESLPFDGLVVDLGLDRELTRASPLGRAAFEPAVNELRATPFRKLTDNFQKLHLGARNVPWFDDATFATIVANFETATALVRAAGLRGYFVDNQVYGVKLWSYPDNAQGRSFAEVEAKVAERGEAVMAAMLRAFPDVALLFEFGSSELFRHVCIEGQALEPHLYGLYPAFLDGMARAISNAKRADALVDVYLPAYPTRDPEAFAAYYNLIHVRWDRLVDTWRPGIVTHWDAAPSGQKRFQWRATPQLTCAPEMVAKLGRERSAGFGIMIDYDSASFATDPAMFGRNYFSPEALEIALTAALRRTDRYVWLWQEQFNVLGITEVAPEPGRPPALRLPTAYLEAIVRARQKAEARP